MPGRGGPGAVYTARPMGHEDNGDEPVANFGILVAVAIMVVATLWTSVANAPRARVVPLAVVGSAYLLASTLGWRRRCCS